LRACPIVSTFTATTSLGLVGIARDAQIIGAMIPNLFGLAAPDKREI